jgi:hypothetical protein
MNTYKVVGYSYELGYYVMCGTVQAKTKRAALLAARRTFDTDGFGYEHFLVSAA